MSLRERIMVLLRSNGLALQDLAEILGVSKSTLANKVNEKTEFTLGEIKYISEVFKLTPEEVYKIFLK